ncbi:MAG: diguanylate cyclase domain-containing protein, partial [Persicimonas sp.]
VIDRSADPADILQRARGGRTTAEHVSMLVFSSNSERFPLFEAALAREPVDVVFASEIDTAEDAFEMWSPHLVLVDRTETAEDSRALLEQLRHSDPFSPTRFVRVADSGDTLAGGELGGRGEFFDEMLCAPLSWADIRRTVRRQIAHVNYGKMRLEKDSLTGVRSALVLAEHLQSCLDEAHHHGDSVMLTGLDVDELDEINERYGRSVGDSVLRSLADSLYLAVGSRELIYRTPADEFFVLQRVDSKDWYDARDRLDSALRVFQKQTFRAPDGRGTYATATGGTVVVPPVRVSAEVCLEKCWIVLDRSMRSRRSRLLVAQLDPSMLPEREPSRDRADERE